MARTVLKIYEGMQKLYELFDGADEDGILLAESCTFKPGKGMTCTGGVTNFATNDGFDRRLHVVSQEMEQTFEAVDSSGLPVSYRWLATTCDGIKFEGPDCPGKCDCTDKVSKAKCLARQLRCKGKNTEGLSFPFMNDPSKVLGLLSGGDIDIIEFNPPPLTFAFSYDFKTVLYTPPIVNLVVDFGVSVTVEYSLVLNSKGIREAVEEKNPLKARFACSSLFLFPNLTSS